MNNGVNVVDQECADHRGTGGSRQSVRVIGRVDVRTVGTLRSLLHAAIDSGSGSLRVDVAELELGDNAALGVLLGGARRARARGRSMVLVDVPTSLGAPLAAARLGRLVRFEETPDLLHVGHA